MCVVLEGLQSERPTAAPMPNASYSRSSPSALDRATFFGESSLRRACKEFVEHYHTERVHQGLGSVRVVCSAVMVTGEVECTGRLGGILKHYRRAA